MEKYLISYNTLGLFQRNQIFLWCSLCACQSDSPNVNFAPSFQGPWGIRREEYLQPFVFPPWNHTSCKIPTHIYFIHFYFIFITLLKNIQILFPGSINLYSSGNPCRSRPCYLYMAVLQTRHTTLAVTYHVLPLCVSPGCRCTDLLPSNLEYSLHDFLFSALFIFSLHLCPQTHSSILFNCVLFLRGVTSPYPSELKVNFIPVSST